MSIQSVIANYMASQNANGNSSSSSSGSSVEQTFLNLMKESPAQRMIDQWLKAHHLTEKELQSMPAAKRDAIEKQMAQDFENSIKRKTEDELQTTTMLG